MRLELELKRHKMHSADFRQVYLSQLAAERFNARHVFLLSYRRLLVINSTKQQQKIEMY